MERKLIEFINHMRKGGSKVSLVETLDCFNALNLLPWDKENFYNILQATLVKDYEDYPLFDKLFYYYFNEDRCNKDSFFSPLTDQAIKNSSAEGKCCGKEAGSLGGGLGYGQGGVSLPKKNFVSTIALGNEGDLLTLIEAGIFSLGEIKESHLYQREETLKQIKVNLRWKMGEYELEKLTKDKELEKIRVAERLRYLEKLLEDKLDAALLEKFEDKALEEMLKKANLKELDFFALTTNQTIEIRKRITQLAHKLATRLSRRVRNSKKGKIRLQGTIRKAMSTGGIPICPIYFEKKPSRPEFIILCDLSGSVKLFSEFMLQLVYSIQSRFFHVRSFAFVDTVHEVTEYFKEKDITKAIKEIYYHGKFSKTGFSHYGESFKAFNKQYLNLITKKTTVLVLGDARNNYQLSFQEELEEISQKAYRLIWINPARKETWDKEDSILSAYKPYCSQIFECRNLKQLERLAKDIF